MPRPLGHLSLSLLPCVKSLPATLDPVGGGQNANWRCIVRHKAANIMVCQAAVTVGCSASVTVRCRVWSKLYQCGSPKNTGPILHAVTVKVGVPTRS